MTTKLNRYAVQNVKFLEYISNKYMSEKTVETRV